jgi:hypothetical protein
VGEQHRNVGGASPVAPFYVFRELLGLVLMWRNAAAAARPKHPQARSQVFDRNLSVHLAHDFIWPTPFALRRPFPAASLTCNQPSDIERALRMHTAWDTQAELLILRELPG